jgi:D-alanine-D-alanine ligase
VLILYNQPLLPEDHPDAAAEHDVLATVDVVAQTLAEAGFDTDRFGASRDPGVLVERLSNDRPDAVFNLFEGTAEQSENEVFVAGILEWLNIPFTGSPSRTLQLARDKHLAKLLFRGAGLPTPQFFAVERLPLPEHDLEWPLIAKPATQDASIGVDQRSVVTEPRALRERIAHLLDSYGPPVLVEQFIRGRELNIGVIGGPEPRCLPASEIVFVDQGPEFWPIVTYEAKWKPGSRDDQATRPRCPAELSPELEARVTDLALRAFRLLGCRDYARVDFRVRPPDEPFILEVNPNPDFNPGAGFARALRAAGLTHTQFTVELIRSALARK